MLYDRAAKKARGYVEKDSIVRQDGSEKLVGKDWTNRKFELWQKCGARCEWWIITAGRFYRCVHPAEDPHHIKARSKGRDDRLSNLQALCRYHHNLLDKRKVKWST